MQVSRKTFWSFKILRATANQSIDLRSPEDVALRLGEARSTICFRIDAVRLFEIEEVRDELKS